MSKKSMKEAPATEAPATEAPATEAPATEAPVTEADPNAALRKGLAALGLQGSALEAALQAAISAQAAEKRAGIRDAIAKAIATLRSDEPVVFSVTIGSSDPIVTEAARPAPVARRAARQGFVKGGDLLQVVGKGTALTGTYKGHEFRAFVTPDGGVEVEGLGKFSGPSAASRAAIRTVSPDFPSSNGWEFWRLREDGRKIGDLR